MIDIAADTFKCNWSSRFETLHCSHSHFMPTLTPPAKSAIKECAQHPRGAVTRHGFCVAETFICWKTIAAHDCAISTVFAAESGLTACREPVRGLKDSRSRCCRSDLFQLYFGPRVLAMGDALCSVRHDGSSNMFRGQSSPHLILDGIQDPGNAGRILRAAEAFGATDVLPKGTRSARHRYNVLRGSAARLSCSVGGGDGGQFPTGPRLNNGRSATCFCADVRADRELGECNLARQCANHHRYEDAACERIGGAPRGFRCAFPVVLNR